MYSSQLIFRLKHTYSIRFKCTLSYVKVFSDILSIFRHAGQCKLFLLGPTSSKDEQGRSAFIAIVGRQFSSNHQSVINGKRLSSVHDILRQLNATIISRQPNDLRRRLKSYSIIVSVCFLSLYYIAGGIYRKIGRI